MSAKIEYCQCNVGITNVFHNGNCIKCRKKVNKEKPYYWQVKKIKNNFMEALNEKEFKAILEFFYEAGRQHTYKENERNKMIDEGTKQAPESPSFENTYFAFTATQPTKKK